MCKQSFTDVNFKAKNMCGPCYRHQVKHRTRRNKKRPKPADEKQNICWEWVEKMKHQRYMTDMYGLSDLIEVFHRLGGSDVGEDGIKPGKQLQMMFDYVMKKYNEENERVRNLCE